MIFTRIDTPIGVLTLAGEGDALCHIEFPDNRHPTSRDAWVEAQPGAVPAVLVRAEAQLRDYFAGRRRSFDLPLSPRGTPFQLRVWQVLNRIPFGQTWSYRQLADACGNGKAMRAVGAANGRNPLPIVVPCHRVIGADGRLVGFGGGIETKAALLRLEGAWPAMSAARLFP